MYTTSIVTPASTNCVKLPGMYESSACAWNLYQGMNFPIQKRIPIKIILNDDEEVTSIENNSETTEENSLYKFTPFSTVSSSCRYY